MTPATRLGHPVRPLLVAPMAAPHLETPRASAAARAFRTTTRLGPLVSPAAGVRSALQRVATALGVTLLLAAAAVVLVGATVWPIELLTAPRVLVGAFGAGVLGAVLLAAGQRG